MPSALDGFLTDECDEHLAGQLRAEVEAAHGSGYDHFQFNLFAVEFFYAEGRVRIVEAVPLGFDDSEVTLAEFLAAIADVPSGPRMPGRPRRAITPPPRRARNSASGDTPARWPSQLQCRVGGSVDDRSEHRLRSLRDRRDTRDA
jgi:hypothetical protein